MRKLIVLLGLLAIVCSQEVVVDNWTGQYNTGTQVVKTYNNNNWANNQEVAVYGWFKINSALPRDNWNTIFHLTSNSDQNFKDYQTAGDRVLAFFMVNANLHNPTYNLANGNANQYNDINFANTDLDKWNFFYVAYGPAQKTRLAWYNLAGSGIKYQSLTGVTHNPSTYYKLFVGQSVNYKYFPGSLWRVTIDIGVGAYRESNFEAITNVTPSSNLQCPVLFTGCAYTGVAVNTCNNLPNFDVRTIRSIWVPNQYIVTIYDNNNYAGKKVSYNKSIECIGEFNWAMLINENAITITDDDRSLKGNFKKNHKRH